MTGANAGQVVILIDALHCIEYFGTVKSSTIVCIGRHFLWGFSAFLRVLTLVLKRNLYSYIWRCHKRLSVFWHFTHWTINKQVEKRYPDESIMEIIFKCSSDTVLCRHMKCFVLLRVGNRILTLGEVPKDQVYGVKLKGVSVCFAMLKAVLSGNYVNFGVFRLYGDDALDNALQTFIKLLLSIPHSDLLVCSSMSLFRMWNIFWQLGVPYFVITTHPPYRL